MPWTNTYQEKFSIEKRAIRAYETREREEEDGSVPAVSTGLVQKRRTNETASEHRAEVKPIPRVLSVTDIRKPLLNKKYEMDKENIFPSLRSCYKSEESAV